jgi:hypothetical protein
VQTAGASEAYFITLVGLDGVVAQAEPTTRSPKTYYFPPSSCQPGRMCIGAQTANMELPEVSISKTHLYFLDGDQQIKSLAPNGNIQSVINVAAPPNSQVTFAVSPDDQRIAVAVITLATANVADSFSEQMYVEDLSSAANRIALYTSTTVAEWPVGWHAGDLVVAVASDMGGGVGIDNSYGGKGYRSVDPADGHVLASLDCTAGLLVQAGTACAAGFCSTPASCQDDGTLSKQDWNGNKTVLARPPGPAPKILTAFNSIHLSPDGTRIVAPVVTDPKTGSLETDLFSDGSQTALTSVGDPIGWLDNDQLLMATFGAVWIVDINRGTTTLAMERAANEPAFPRLSGVLPANL